MSCQRFMEFHDGIEAGDGLHGRRTLAAAIGMNADISRQHRGERFHVAAARGGEESIGKLQAAFFLYPEARPRFADMGARAGSELAAGGGVTLDGGRDFLETQPEHVMQQKGRPLERR